MLDRMAERMRSRSAALVLAIDGRLDRILQLWLLFAGLVAAARIAFTRIPSGAPDASTAASYLLVVLAPVASTLLALRWFRDGDELPQPVTRLARVGRWRTVE